MRVLDDEVDDIDNAYEEAQDRSSLSANRFNFNDLYVSDDDDSENESALEIQPYLMEETGLVEGGLMELTSEHQLGVKVCSYLVDDVSSDVEFVHNFCCKMFNYSISIMNN
ncbi:uncharacterized protein LOC133832878 [Humulus lupulus]|uniref:uncharacterized protein LOC133832878 n=1 Tax=Humulus lupulus TaxID=3486 RepID=UPI002B41132B|nr:uncharacterized protein LOC133832878 [Humulus lupulus]